MSRYLVDNSVLQRLPRNPAVQVAVGKLLDAEHELCCCALSLDEFAYSARSAMEHAEASRRLRTSFLYLPLSPALDQIILDIRAALWQAGTGRAAGVVDVMLAAIAVEADAAVLHYDSDFDHIAAAFPRLRSEWIVRRGAVD
ncbi:MAG TPA: PIN domain-containing protein [Jatrophihabitans sp.]|nr:PIN domain-containing protein [Jatrophihabitans sp.]